MESADNGGGKCPRMAAVSVQFTILVWIPKTKSASSSPAHCPVSCKHSLNHTETFQSENISLD